MSRRAPTPIMPLLTDKNVREFWLQVVRAAGESGCWLWTGLTRPSGHSAGYGRFYTGLPGKKIVSAHRFAWVATNNRDVPDGMELDHVCRNRACNLPVTTSKEMLGQLDERE